MNGFLSVKDFASHQHYRDRRPPWIKLHAAVLDDYAFTCLPDASKAHLMLIWVLASKLNNRVPNDATWIGRQIGATSVVDLEVLIASGLLIVERGASATKADRLQDALVETEAEAVPSTHPAIDRFIEGLPEGQNEQRWRAIVEDWQGGLGLGGGKPASPEDVAVGLTEYMLEDGRDFSPIHVRSFVERARRARLKAVESGNHVPLAVRSINGKRGGPKEYDYSKPTDKPGEHKWT